MVSFVVFHGEPETNIPFEFWMLFTPPTRGPKFLMITPFSGPFITNVEKVPLFFADENMTQHYNHRIPQVLYMKLHLKCLGMINFKSVPPPNSGYDLRWCENSRHQCRVRMHKDCCYNPNCLKWRGRKAACSWLNYLTGNDY